MKVVPLDRCHWPAVQAIYQAGIDTGHATFEAAPPSWEDFDASRRPDHRLACLDEAGEVVGWAAVSSTSARPVYAGVVEHSVYVAPSVHGQGVGRLLLDALLASADAGGLWTVQSGIFPENTASLALHAAAGFRTVGVRERVGLMSYGPLAGRWRDVVLLERRRP